MDYYDPRLELVLSPGDVFCWKGETYCVSGPPLGYGGTAVIYPLRQAGGEDGLFALKECFPAMDASDGGFFRENGVIRACDPDAQRRLDSARRAWEKEVRISQRLNRVCHSALDVWSRESITADSITTGGQTYRLGQDYTFREGQLFLLRREDTRGAFLSRVLACSGVPNLYFCVQIIQKVLFALQQFHNAGILHGDLHPDNVYLADFLQSSGQFSAVKLADLSSAQELANGRAERPLEDILVRPGFRPPESYVKSGETVLLTPAYDLYQVGRLLLYMISGSDYLDSSRRDTLYLNPDLVAYLPEERDLIRLGCPYYVQEQVQAFVQRLLEETPGRRFKTVQEAMAELEPLLEKLRPQPAIFSGDLPALNQDQLLPRAQQVRQLLQKFDHSRVCFVSCMGGMGKTVFELQAADAWKKRGGRAFFVSFPGSIPELFTKSFALSLTPQRQSEVLYGHPSDQEICRRILELLDCLTENDLLIIDDLYADGKTLSQLLESDLDEGWKRELFPRLCQKKCRILISTRYSIKDLTRYSFYELLPFDEADLLNLMRRICPAANREADQELLDIIQETGRSTIMVRMVASLMRQSCCTAQVVLKKLRSGSLDATPILQDVRGQLSARSIASHLKALFELGNLGKWEKNILCCALLLGKEGLPYQLFRQACLSCAPEAEQEQVEQALYSLTELEYLKTADRSVSIHSLIRMTARDSLLASEEQRSAFCGQILPFFRAVWKEGGSSDTRFVPARTLQQVFGFCEAARAEAERWHAGDAVSAELLFRTGQLLQALGLYGKAQSVLRQAGVLYQKLPAALPENTKIQSDHAQLLIAQAKNIVRWKDLSRFPQAVSYAGAARELLEKNGLAESFLGVKVLAVFGRICGESQHYDLQELYYTQSFALAEKLHSAEPSSFKNKLALADAYTNCSWNQLHKNRFAEAYQSSLQAIRLYEELMEESEARLSASCSAEEAHQRSRLLAAAGAYNMHADSARALRLAEPEDRLRMYQSEKKALGESMSLRSVLPQEHPLLIFQYQRQARFQCEDAFPPFAPQFDRDKWEKGIQLFEKALQIQNGPNLCKENKDRGFFLLELAEAYQRAATAVLLDDPRSDTASRNDALTWLRQAESALGEAASMSGLSRPKQAARERLVLLYKTFCFIPSLSFRPDPKFSLLWRDDPFYQNLLADLPPSP